MNRAFDPDRHCGAKTNRGTRCVHIRGERTDHKGAGNCWLHGGRTPNGRKHAETEAAAKTLASLAVPVEGDPLEVLQATVESAYGVLLAARELLLMKADEVHVELYVGAIDRAQRVAKAAVESVSIDRMDKINARIVDMLERATDRALERLGIAARKRDTFRELLREEIAVELVGSRN